MTTSVLFLIAVLSLLAALVLLALFLYERAIMKTVKGECCIECGYRLIDQQTRCPECGWGREH